jgi:CubicO group peptidase (beta-lactamase class C family)
MKAKIRQCVVFSVLVLLAMGALAQDLPTAKPEDVGFSSERLAYIDAFLTEKVSHGDLAGIVTLISRHGKVVHFSAIGYADLEKQRKMEKDTIFRQYSMTKAIASTALMTLYEQGRFQMRDPISKYLPEFANIRVLRTPDSPLDETVAPERPPSIHDIFRHTAGFSHGLTTNALDTQYAKSDLFGVDVSLKEMMERRPSYRFNTSQARSSLTALDPMCRLDSSKSYPACLLTSISQSTSLLRLA